MSNIKIPMETKVLLAMFSIGVLISVSMMFIIIFNTTRRADAALERCDAALDNARRYENHKTLQKEEEEEDKLLLFTPPLYKFD